MSEAEASGTSTSINTMMVIVSVSVVSVAVVLAVAAVLVRNRRRLAAVDRSTTELVDRHSRNSSRPSSFKPPDLFVVGEPTDTAPPPGYSGPIVVLHCGEGEDDADELKCCNSLKPGEVCVEEELDESGGELQILRWPCIAIARPEVTATSVDVVEEEKDVDSIGISPHAAESRTGSQPT